MALFIRGPIGAVISPLLGGYKDFKDLPYACSLCTACDNVCPVRIPLSKLILRHRRVMAEKRDHRKSRATGDKNVRLCQ